MMNLVECNCKLTTDVDYYNLPLACPKVWDMLARGLVKGIFQLESQLCKQWTKEIKPKNINDISSIISLVRPGTLQAKVDNKNMTKHYADRKNKIDPVPKYHPIFDEILKDTFGVICLHEDSFISLNNGMEKHIKELNNGYIVNCIDLETNICTSSICDGVQYTKTEDGLILRLQNGYEVCVTNDHNIWTDSGWKRADALDINNDLIAVSVKQSHVITNKTNIANWLGNDIDVSYFLGQMTGDGCSIEALATGTEENTNIMLEWFKQKMPSITTRKYFHTRSWYIALSYNNKTNLRDLLRENNLHKTKNNKYIPDIIFTSNDNVRRSFLAGLFDADGHAGVGFKNMANCHYCSNNYHIINGIRKLLSIDGIETRISTDRKHLFISNTRKFKELLEPYIQIKHIQGIVYNAKQYGVIKKSRLVDYIQTNNKSIKSFCKEYKISASNLFRKHKFISDRFAELMDYNLGDIRFIKIKSINKVYNQKFYGMSVRKYHNMIANGILVKNCYQEQSITIAQLLAGFNLSEADSLRKAMGKKIVELMAKVEKNFMEKAKAYGVITEEQAKYIFSQIKASQRYSFNKSHSIAYAIDGYYSAWLKAHYPKVFFCSWLKKSDDKPHKQTEIMELVNEAKLFDIDVLPPDIQCGNPRFNIIDGHIKFGLCDIKGFGDSYYKKFQAAINGIDIKSLNWYKFLTKISGKINSSGVVGLIKSGALPYNETRNQMLYEFYKWIELTEREQEYIRGTFAESLVDGLAYLLSSTIPNKKRKVIIDGLYQSLIKPPMSLDDSIAQIAINESLYLGVPITCHIVDGYNLATSTVTCKDLVNGCKGKVFIIAELKTKRVIKCKNGVKNKGKEMAFASIEDGSGLFDSVVIFPDAFEKISQKLIENSVVLWAGRQDNKGSLVVDDVWEA